MRKIASIGFAIVALAATALPALADDQAIGYATGRIGGAPAWSYDREARTTWWPYGAQRTAPSSYGTYAQYNDYAQYGEYPQGGGYLQRSCTYSGGPKASNNWTCQ
jgi:hypothetical protein